jgi:hypothetical protein
LTFQSFDLDLIKVILETKQVDGTNFDIYIMTTINISTCKEHNRLILNISHLLTLKPLVSSRTPGMTWNINYCATGRQKHHIFNCFPLLNIKFDTLLMLVIDVLFFYVFSENLKANSWFSGSMTPLTNMSSIFAEWQNKCFSLQSQRTTNTETFIEVWS